MAQTARTSDRPENRLAQLLQTMVADATEMVGAESGLLGIVERRGEVVELVYRECYSDHTWQLLGDTRQPWEGVAGRALATGEPQIINDLAAATPSDQGAARHDIPSGDTRVAVNLAAVPVRDPAGEVIAVLLVFNKVAAPFTERDVQLLAIFARHASLAFEYAALWEAERQAHERLALVFAQTPVGLALVDAAGRYVLVNPALAALNGQPIEAHLGRTATEVLGPAAADGDAIVRQVASTGEAVVLRNQPIPPPPGSERLRYVDVSFYPLQGARGAVDAVLVVIQDVTEHEEEQVRQTQFLGMVAHELKNPLTPVKVNVQLLRRRLAKALDDPAMVRTLDSIDRNLGRLENRISDLQQAAHIRSGAFTLRREPCDLMAVAHGVIAEQAEQADGNGTTPIHLEGPPELRGIWDCDRLHQALTNLVSNAVKYSPVNGEVRVEVASSDDEVTVTVSDQGIGLRPEDLDDLFLPYSRLYHASEVKGTGLGLYITRGIVEAHGGRIWAESEGPGRGSRFRFTLPREPR